MSASLDAQLGDPYYTDSLAYGIGPQSDGTNIPAPASVQTTPVDAGGGPAGQYGQQVLDVFKFGVGVWNSQVQQGRLLDYRRWEATNLGINTQGQPAAYGAVRVQGTANPTMLILIAIAAFVALKG